MKDCIKLILELVISVPKNGATYKNLLLTCKSFHEYYKQRHEVIVEKYTDYTLTLFKKFGDKDWNWNKVALNHFNKWDQILEVVSKQTLFKIRNLTLKKIIKIDTLEKYNKKSILKLVLAYVNLDMEVVSRHKNLTKEIILSHPGIGWDWKYIVQRFKDLDVNNIFRTPNSLLDWKIRCSGLEFLERYDNFGARFIINNKRKWNFRDLSEYLYK